MASILVIDDDPYIRELVSALLAGEGFAINEVKNGRDALKKLVEIKADLCALGLMMPMNYCSSNSLTALDSSSTMEILWGQTSSHCPQAIHSEAFAAEKVSHA